MDPRDDRVDTVSVEESPPGVTPPCVPSLAKERAMAGWQPTMVPSGEAWGGKDAAMLHPQPVSGTRGAADMAAEGMPPMVRDTDNDGE